MLLLWPAALVVLSFQVVSHFLFHEAPGPALDAKRTMLEVTSPSPSRRGFNRSSSFLQFSDLVVSFPWREVPFCPLDPRSVSRRLYLTPLPFLQIILPLQFFVIEIQEAYAQESRLARIR